MTQCSDIDKLVSLGTALEWDVERQLTHIVACDDCSRRLRELQTLYQAVTEEVTPRPGFATEVVNELPIHQIKPAKSTGRLVATINTLLASATAFFAIALVSTGGSGIEMGLPAVGLAVFTGVATLVWNSSRSTAVLERLN